MPRRRVGREELTAVLLASVFVLAAAGWWRQFDRARALGSGSEQPRVGDDSLSADPLVNAGRLDNGMRYYIRANRSPKQRAELRLVVKVGSVVEAPDERGFAHAVEHMLFRGTRHFPRRTVQEYLESVGMRNGEDLNGITSRDETTFEIRVPTDRLGVLDTAIAMLADMAHEATFDPEEARVEGGIVMAEWRSRRGGAARHVERRDSIMLAGSPYLLRSPIGDTAVIRRFDVTAMRRFYSRWYRPDRMAIIAVGDFDPLFVDRLVKQYFGAIPRPAMALATPPVTVPPVTGVHAFVLTDPEETGTELSLWIPRPVVRRATRSSYRQRVAMGIWRSILNKRLREAAERPDSPFLFGSAEQEGLTRSLDADVLSVDVADGRLPEALDELIGEVNRLQRHGPTEGELRDQVDGTIRMREQAAQWADDSEDLVLGYAEEFLAGHRAMTRSSSLAEAHRVLPTLGVKDVMTAARRAALDSGAYVFVTTSAAVHRPSADSLLRLTRLAMRREVRRRDESSRTIVLATHPPAEGSVLAQRPLTEVGAYEWTLSNGMRVILKPTRFTFNQLAFRLFAPGGASLAGESAFASAYYADELLRAMGIGQVDGRSLARRLDESSIDLSLQVHDGSIEFRGFTAPDDLELLFQVLHLHFTSPRADTVAFRQWRDRRIALAARRERDPDSAFDDSLATAVSQHHAHTLRSDRVFIRDVELSRALDFWRARTRNASNFTLVLVGDFTLDRVRTFATRYLASLPAGTRELPRDDGVRFPSTAVRRAFRAGEDPRARTSIVLSGPGDQVEGPAEALSLARDVAELALGERIRETLGATYDVHVTASTDVVPPLEYRVTISFESDPAQIDSLATIALQELDRLRKSGPTEAEVAKVRASQTRDLDDRIDDNSYWAHELAWHSRPGFRLTSITAHQAKARALSSDELRAACATYLGTARYVRVTMLPQRPRRHQPSEEPSVAERGLGSGR